MTQGNCIRDNDQCVSTANVPHIFARVQHFNSFVSSVLTSLSSDVVREVVGYL